MHDILTIIEHALLAVAMLALPLALIFSKKPWSFRLFGVICLFAVGGWIEVSVLDNAIVGRAMEFSQSDSWFKEIDEPVKFWMSVFIHGILGAALIWFAVWVTRRPLGDIPKSNPYWPNTPITRFAPWFMLVLVLVGVVKRVFY